MQLQHQVHRFHHALSAGAKSLRFRAVLVAACVMIAGLAVGSTAHALTITAAQCTGYGGTVQNFGSDACYIGVAADGGDNTVGDWEAQAAALDPAFHLVSIHSQAENDYVWSLKGGNSEIAIGLVDLTAGGGVYVFDDPVWTDGSAVDYTNWHPTDGITANLEDAAFMWGANGGQWSDIDDNNPTVYAVFKAQVVPEPSAGLLVGSGLLALARYRRRKSL